jgi:hypothetical protein
MFLLQNVPQSKYIIWIMYNLLFPHKVSLHTPQQNNFQTVKHMSWKGKQSIPRLGVDVGGVLREADGIITTGDEFDAAFLQAPALESSIEVLATLVQAFKPENVFIVSKAKQDMQRRTMLWFDEIDLFNRTGIPKRNVYFCREHGDKGVVTSKLRITHFVDDREKVLRALPASVGFKILFGGNDEEVKETQEWIEMPKDWHVVGDYILASLANE